MKIERAGEQELTTSTSGLDPTIEVSHEQGDLLELRVDALVNPWNRNFVPRGLLLVGGLSGQLKKRTGPEPWRALAKAGVLGVGDVVVTGAGRYDNTTHLIHVAGLNAWWRSSPEGVTACVVSAVRTAASLGARSLALPLIGAGHGGMKPGASAAAIEAGLATFAHDPVKPALRVRVVRLAE